MVDARGKACPLPIVEVSRALRQLPSCELWATDPATKADLESFCAATGHQLQKTWQDGQVFKAWVERKRP